MGWASCGEDSQGRPIGYSVEGVTCDFEGCEAEIHRGISYACGGMHGPDYGCCDNYFCGDHEEVHKPADYDEAREWGR